MPCFLKDNHLDLCPYLDFSYTILCIGHQHGHSTVDLEVNTEHKIACIHCHDIIVKINFQVKEDFLPYW